MTTAASNRARSTCCCKLRRRGQQHAPCARKSRRVCVRRPMIRHGHAPAQRGAELHHRAARPDRRRSAAVRAGRQRARQTGAAEAVELDDPAVGRDRIGAGLRRPGSPSAVAGNRAAGPDRPPPRASSRWAGPAPRNRARRHSGRARAARSTAPSVAKGSQFAAGSSRTSQTSMPPSQPAPRPHSRSSSPPLSYRTSLGTARLEHRRRVRGEVALEAAAGEDALVATASADEHLCAGLAVGRAPGGDDGRQHERRPLRAGPFVHRQQLMQ